MNHAYQLSGEYARIVSAALPRHRMHLPQLKPRDPALRALSDFVIDPPVTVPEQTSLADAFDDMFRAGVRAILVVNQLSVRGLVSADLLRRVRLTQRQRVSDVMVAARDIPAIDWNTLQESNVSDLMEIFEATGVRHLLALQTDTVNLSHVRGLVHRERLERQLLNPLEA